MEARKFQELFLGGRGLVQDNGDIEKCNNIDNFDSVGNCCVSKYLLIVWWKSFFSCFHDIVKKVYCILGGQHHRNGTKCPLIPRPLRGCFRFRFFRIRRQLQFTTMKRDVNGFIGGRKKGILSISFFEEQLPQTVISQTTVINSNRVSLPRKYSLPPSFLFTYFPGRGKQKSSSPLRKMSTFHYSLSLTSSRVCCLALTATSYQRVPHFFFSCLLKSEYTAEE